MSTAAVDIANLAVRVTDISRNFKWYKTLAHGTTVDPNHTENNLASVNRAFFRLVRENEDGSWTSLQSVEVGDPQLLSLAADLRTANGLHVDVLRRIGRGELHRSGGRRRSSLQRMTRDHTEMMTKLDAFVAFIRDGTQHSSEAACDGWHARLSAHTQNARQPSGLRGGGWDYAYEVPPYDSGWGLPIEESTASGWGALVAETPAGSGWGAHVAEPSRQDGWGGPCDSCSRGRWGGPCDSCSRGRWCGWGCAPPSNTAHRTDDGHPQPAPRVDQAAVAAESQREPIVQAAKAGKSVQALVSGLASAAAESEQRDAGWQEAIRKLKEVVGEQQRGMVALKAEISAAVAAEAARREAEVQTLRQQLQAEQEGRKSLEQEVKSLKEELSALRVSVASISSAPAIPDWTTEGGLDILIPRSLSSSHFTEIITRLLSFTVGHTLSLSVGCFAIVDPERIVQIAGACGIQHSLAALGALHDLPAWAGERVGLFKGLVEGALANGSTASAVEPKSKTLDEEMLAMLKAGDIGDPTPGDARMEEVSAAFAEEKEAIRSAWVDLVQAIKAQCQTALSEITEHRAAANDSISTVGAEALRAISEQSELELFSLDGKADKLDRAMLDFQRLYPAPPSSSTPLPTAITTMATTSPHPDSVKIISLLEQLVAAQPTARFTAPSTPTTTPMAPFPAHPSLIPSGDLCSSTLRDETTAAPGLPFNTSNASRSDDAAGLRYEAGRWQCRSVGRGPGKVLGAEKA